MKWLENFIYRCVHRARSRDEIVPVESTKTGRGNTLSPNKRVASNYDDEGVINFTIYSASGGRIVETIRYDSKNDRERASRYIIPDAAEFGESLAKIVTMECLK